jgi:spermidine/putrescine-binding protein
MPLKGSIFSFITACLVLTACKVEKARPFKKQHLYIASDCLTYKDSSLFRTFEKRWKVDVHIFNFSTDSLEEVLISEGINSAYDVVILSSVYDMHEFNEKELLQRIPEESFPKELPLKYRSKSRKWCGLGIDPYIILTKDDSVNRVRSYRDLSTKSNWCTDLKKNNQWYPFYAVIAQKIDPKSTFSAVNWITNFTKKRSKIFAETDSVQQCNTVLTNYSQYRKNELFRSKFYKKHQVIFPNQRSGGTYFNMPCFAVVKQARNYTSAIKFLNYLFIESVNKRINFHWSDFPLVMNKQSAIAYQNIRFKKYNVSPIRLTSNYDRVKNILGITD